MTQRRNLNFEDIDSVSRFLPRPLALCIKLFKSEFLLAVKALISRLDLVTKDEFLVQKRMLDDAYKEIDVLQGRLSERE